MIRFRPKPQRPYVPSQIPRCSPMRSACEIKAIFEWLQYTRHLGLLPLHSIPVTALSEQRRIRKSLTYRTL